MFRVHSSVKLFQRVTRLHKKNQWLYPKHFALFSNDAINDTINYDMSGWPILSNVDKTSTELPNSVKVSEITDGISTNFRDNIVEISTIPDKMPEIAVDSPKKLFFLFEWFISILENIHCSTGLPWWATVMSVTIGIRCLLLPSVPLVRRNAINVQLASPYTSILQEKLKKSSKTKGKRMNSKQINSIRQEIKDVMAKYDAKHWPFLIPLLCQAPIFFSFFNSLRHLGPRCQEFSSEGLFWFKNLGMADPYHILPVLTGVTTFAVIHFGSEGGGKNSIPANTKKMMQVFCFFLPVMTHTLPAGLFIYWNTNNIFSLLQGKVFEFAAVKKRFRINTIDETELKELAHTVRMEEMQKARGNAQRKSLGHTYTLPKNITYINDLKRASRQKKQSRKGKFVRRRKQVRKMR